ncbi:hypothetical protein QCA50_010423 [Cerrena zonata]|uniref:Uncharacterized protein n=1 Tax=Cerrena zonata TaxID=2478898 RepID=A0AAW0FYP8_9APHY
MCRIRRFEFSVKVLRVLFPFIRLLPGLSQLLFLSISSTSSIALPLPFPSSCRSSSTTDMLFLKMLDLDG